MTYDELIESILTAKEKMLQHSIEANSVTLNGRKYGILIENLPPNMKPTVFGMAVKSDYALPDDHDFLVQYEPPQPKTNADRIRAMTDEELARWLSDMHDSVTCPNYGDYDCVTSCRVCWLDWLQTVIGEANEHDQ